MSSFTILGSAGPLEVGHAPGKVWVGGAFLSPDDADLLADFAHKAAEEARAEAEPAAERPVDPGKFL